MADLHSHIARAVERLGSQAKLAQAAGCSQQYISWLLADKKRRISAEMAMAFDKATDGDVSKHELRPDIFGAPDPSKPPEPKGYIGEPTPAPRGWKEPGCVS